MRTLALIITAAFAAAAPLAAPPTTVSAQTDDLASATTCGELQATRIRGTPNAVTVRLRSVPHPGAAITAYGATTQWSAPVGPYATVPLGHGDQKEYSFVVRADGPIEAVLYQRTNPACTSHAAVREPNDYDGPDVERPTIALTDRQPLEPINCARRYAPATTIQAEQPVMPRSAQLLGIVGVVYVLVTIDVRGQPTNARVIKSPGSVLDAPSIQAAMQSTFSPEIFRCHSVPGTYVFGVSYS